MKQTHLQKNKTEVGLKFPTRVSINITHRCNLRCKHCLNNSGKSGLNELKTSEIFNLIDQLSINGRPVLAIGGGEPLIREDLFKIVEYAKEKSVPVSIITNGLLLNEEIAKKLDKLNLTALTVSVDGLSKNNDSIRGSGNFKKIIKNVKLLVKNCRNTKLAMRVTVNSLNVNECKKIIALAEKLRLNTIRLAPVLPIGRIMKNEHLLLSQEQYIQFIKDCREVKSSIEVILPDEDAHPNSFRVGQFGCHCGKEICWITHNGDLYPCFFFGNNFCAGNIREKKFIDLWNKARRMTKLCGNNLCNSCENYKNCRGGCRSRALWKYNDINAVDPYCILRKNKLYEKTNSNPSISIL